jgi:hypothetical protein
MRYYVVLFQVRPREARRDPALLPEREGDRLGVWPSPARLRRSGTEAAKVEVFSNALHMFQNSEPLTMCL